MKKISLLVFILSITISAQEGWFWQNPLPQGNNLISVKFISPLIGWAVGGYGTILRTINGGADWTSQSSETTNYLIGVSFTDANNGTVVGEYATILRTSNCGVTFVEEKDVDEILKTYYLSNNYPNPFNPSTKIKYSVPQLSNVIIKVFDILGNELETLVSEEKPAGTYEITWYAEGLPSGVYLYQLKAGSFIQTKKMLLLK